MLAAVALADACSCPGSVCPTRPISAQGLEVSHRVVSAVSGTEPPQMQLRSSESVVDAAQTAAAIGRVFTVWRDAWGSPTQSVDEGCILRPMPVG